MTLPLLRRFFTGRQARYWLLLGICPLLALLCIPLKRCEPPKTQAERPLWLAPSGNHPVYRHARYVDAALDSLHKPLRSASEQEERVRGVAKPAEVFNDLNPEQLATAEMLGIKPLADRSSGIELGEKLQDISQLRYLHMSEQMTHSIPYLIPRASRLISYIAKSFQDSLAVKGYPPYNLVVTSVLRTEQDLSRLRRSNGNASANSCHRYGTTFDISYRRFYDPHSGTDIEDERLKHILSEVLRDYHDRALCYIKYEYKQSCFHITCR